MQKKTRKYAAKKICLILELTVVRKLFFFLLSEHFFRLIPY